MQYEAMMKEKAKSDMIGGIYHTNLIDIVSNEFESAEENKSWKAFTEALGSVAGDASVMEKDNVESLAVVFGNDREETGFKIGFHIAMRLCMEGLNGGVR